MTDLAATVDNPFGLTGDDFWTDPWRNRPGLHMLVLDMKFGLYIDAPPLVDTATRRSVPAPLYWVARQRDDYAIDFEAEAKVVGVRLDDRAVRVANAVGPVDRALPQRRVGKDSDDPMSRSDVMDLAERLRLLEAPGRWRVFVLLRDQVSNCVTIEVKRTGPVHEDPEAQRFIDSFRRERPIPPPPAPSPGQARTEPPGGVLPHAPPVPSEPGLSATVPRVVLMDQEGTRAPLWLSYRLPVTPFDRVPPPAAPPPGQTGPVVDGYGTPRPTAVLPVCAIALGSQSRRETVVRLNIPSWQALEGEAPMVAGQGGYDLLREESLTVTPQTWWVWVLCGEHVRGPLTMATVTKDQLPKPGE